MSRVARRAGLGLALGVLLAQPARAQAAPPATGGAEALRIALQGLGAERRVLLVAAHPDDEDTSLLAVLARGLGAEASYLSLTRGEGGQNLIGPELGPGLGLLRSGELLAAREIDGARQYFTRAIDYGYSKTLDEALTLWPRDSLLKDAVRIVRRTRPQVMVSVFRGTSRDGHGQHQAAGWVAREAFRVAGDPSVFPELATEEGLAPWRPARYFLSTRFDAAGTTDSLDAGALDPAAGQSYHQLAMRSRSQHRSQDMGTLQRPGPAAVRLALQEPTTGPGGDLFDGVDTGLGGILGPDRARAFGAIADTLRGLGPGDGRRAAPLLDTAWRLLDGAGPDADAQRARLAIAERIFRGVVVDAVGASAEVVPGDSLMVELVLWNAGPLPVALAARLEATPGSGFAVPASAGTCHALAPGTMRTDTVYARAGAGAATTDPYFLRHPPDGWLYDWSGTEPALRGLPFAPQPLTAVVGWCGGGPERELVRRPVTHRVNDQALGEQREPVAVVPAIGVAVEPTVQVWSARRPEAASLTVTLTRHAPGPARGRVGLELPPGWEGGEAVAFGFDGRGILQQRFSVCPPPGAAPGALTVRAVATTDDGRRWETGVSFLRYPHVTTRAQTEPAAVLASVVDLALPPVRRVGYVRGAADRVPEALRALGLPVEVLEPATLERGDLAAYDVIVVGSRAYEVDSALARANGRLLAYVAEGGTVITQYQQQAFFQGGFAPPGLAPAQPDTVRGRPAFPRFDRVTDETAPVRLLAPRHPAFRAPHAIGPDDWTGWVQERGLYFAPAWSEAWTPLLEMADPGEAPVRGALLVTRHGRGTYVYTGLSFFRQLPAGVPGAWRLFLNLLALGSPSP